jgi:hypothetical protein
MMPGLFAFSAEEGMDAQSIVWYVLTSKSGAWWKKIRR